jgi:hypothetical protein
MLVVTTPVFHGDVWPLQSNSLGSKVSKIHIKSTSNYSPEFVAMGSQPASQDLATVLSALRQTLRDSLETLNTPTIASELQAALHDDKQLPDKDIANLASDTVDLLSGVEKLLQPAHLVLADHFLGMYNSHAMGR